ncbi:hypothetical protein FQN50_009501 [Emmonsiellopsis sp. PD_5]|nr:hypothetical protein FQN50_009501 [Emmonsiellopsis sp. PD_5]
MPSIRNVAYVLGALSVASNVAAGPLFENLFPPHGYPTDPYPTGNPDSPTTVTITATVTQTASGCSTATPSPSDPPALQCDPYGYLIQRAVLYRVDLTTGDAEQVKAGLGDGSAINAIGYNPLDNLLYGHQSSTHSLIRIGGDGSSSTVQLSGEYGAPANSMIGDIDIRGHYWVGHRGKEWAEIDLAPGSLTYGRTLRTGTADPLGIAIADWVYIPSAGEYLYAVGGNSTTGGASMIRFDMITHEWEEFANYPDMPVNVFGAMYGMNNGTLYGSDNRSGQIWLFSLEGDDPVLVSQGPVSGSNDGARCVLNLLE